MPQGVASDDQPDAREGQAGRPGVAERFAVPGWKKLGLDQSLGTRIVNYADDLVILCRKSTCNAICSFRTFLVVNWLKHASGPYNAEITEQEAVVTITRAIQKFVGSFEATHPDFEKFSEWAMQKGYTNKPMTEKAK
jgi:hypothetical protein